MLYTRRAKGNDLNNTHIIFNLKELSQKNLQTNHTYQQDYALHYEY